MNFRAINLKPWNDCVYIKILGMVKWDVLEEFVFVVHNWQMISWRNFIAKQKESVVLFNNQLHKAKLKVPTSYKQVTSLENEGSMTENDRLIEGKEKVGGTFTSLGCFLD